MKNTISSNKKKKTDLTKSPKVSFAKGGLVEAVVTVVGVGLISGSFAIALKEKGFAKKIIGVSRTKQSSDKAKELGIINERLPWE